MTEIEDESTESGAHRALRSERRLRKDAEREVAAMRNDLGARVAKLEARGLGQILDVLAEIRRDGAAETAKLRAELHDLAEQVEQLAAMVKAQP